MTRREAITAYYHAVANTLAESPAIHAAEELVKATGLSVDLISFDVAVTVERNGGAVISDEDFLRGLRIAPNLEVDLS